LQNCSSDAATACSDCEAGGARFAAGRSALALVLTVAGLVAWGPFALAGKALFATAIVAGGASLAREAVRQLRRGRLEMNALITIAVTGAVFLGDWAEAAATVALFSVAQLLESRSLARARHAIAALLGLRPERARVLRERREEWVSPEAVVPGELLLVAAGERVPLDGVVLEGASEVDESPLTGESRLRPREPGDALLAGSINGSGRLVLRATRRADQTTLARVIRRVEEAQASRAPSQGFVERFARVYTPVVVIAAVVLSVVPPALGLVPFQTALHRALVLLVIACPCALVLSTPIAIVSALTAASRAGVLIKGGAHLEALGRVRTVAFDKTGTLTSGAPAVTSMWAAAGESESMVLAEAAALERHAGHPLGAAIAAHAAAAGLPELPAEAVVVLPGRGVEGRVNGRQALLGSHRLFDERGLCDHAVDTELRRREALGQTMVLLGDARSGVRGFVAAVDVLRPGAREATGALAAKGVGVVLLSGDNRATSEAIASVAGIPECHADLLPEDKVACIATLRERGPVAMVGDGVNDAPALATADVGIAMGSRGTDAALETADIVLMNDDLRRVPWAIGLGRATRRIVMQNVAFSLALKGAVLGLALAGEASVWAAVGADMGASLLVIGNGLRLLRARPVSEVPGSEPAPALGMAAR
jgi:Zn2+/Cd2+-exporting ATPase